MDRRRFIEELKKEAHPICWTFFSNDQYFLLINIMEDTIFSHLPFSFCNHRLTTSIDRRLFVIHRSATTKSLWSRADRRHLLLAKWHWPSLWHGRHISLSASKKAEKKFDNLTNCCDKLMCGRTEIFCQNEEVFIWMSIGGDIVEKWQKPELLVWFNVFSRVFVVSSAFSWGYYSNAISQGDLFGCAL